MRRIVLSLLALAMGASLIALVPNPSDAAHRCRVQWGSIAKESGDTVAGNIDGIRTGRHQCFDRLVIDLDGPAPGYRVRYVSEFTQDGSGQVVPISGGAILGVTVIAAAHDEDYNSTLDRSTVEAIDLGGYRTFRDLYFDGTFEGLTGFGLGVRARLPYRVSTLDGPGDGSRLIIDVAHRW